MIFGDETSDIYACMQNVFHCSFIDVGDNPIARPQPLYKSRPVQLINMDMIQGIPTNQYDKHLPEEIRDPPESISANHPGCSGVDISSVSEYDGAEPSSVALQEADGRDVERCVDTKSVKIEKMDDNEYGTVVSPMVPESSTVTLTSESDSRIQTKSVSTPEQNEYVAPAEDYIVTDATHSDSPPNGQESVDTETVQDDVATELSEHPAETDQTCEES